MSLHFNKLTSNSGEHARNSIIANDKKRLLKNLKNNYVNFSTVMRQKYIFKEVTPKNKEDQDPNNKPLSRSNEAHSITDLRRFRRVYDKKDIDVNKKSTSKDSIKTEKCNYDRIKIYHKNLNSPNKF